MHTVSAIAILYSRPPLSTLHGKARCNVGKHMIFHVLYM